MKYITIILGMIMLAGVVSAAASFAVTTFSCTPSEAAITDTFSCTAQVQNSGDASGTLGTATLYPSGSWMESSNYPKTMSTSIGVGQSAEVTFTGLRGTIAGNNGYQKITLDSITDTYVADENVETNIIDVAVTQSATASSAAMGVSFDVTAEVTAGGSIDSVLTFTVNSGECSLGSQESTKTMNGMTHGSKQSKTWTVTQGTSGACSYTLTAAATGSGGIASKSDSISNSVSCTDCPTTTSNGGVGSGGGGGGGGGATKYDLGTLNQAKTAELARNEKAIFVFDEENHSIKLSEITDTTATLKITSEEQTALMSVGSEKEIDLDLDGTADIKIKLVSINIIKKTAKITITPLRASSSGGISGNAAGNDPQFSPPEAEGEETGAAEGGIKKISSTRALMIGIIAGLALVIILIIIGITRHNKSKEELLNNKVKVYKESLFSKAMSIIKAK